MPQILILFWIWTIFYRGVNPSGAGYIPELVRKGINNVIAFLKNGVVKLFLI